MIRVMKGETRGYTRAQVLHRNPIAWDLEACWQGVGFWVLEGLEGLVLRVQV